MTPHTQLPHSGEPPEVEANLPKHHAPLPEIWDKDREGLHDPEGIDFIAVQNSAEYRELRSSHVRFAFPMVIVFVGYYFVFVLLSTYAPGFVGARIGDSYIPWGVPLGLLAFASTWFVTWAYVRHANRNLDPRSTALRERLEQKGGAR
ncbi:DUF485 domain-containing protein [Raineyella sp. W15-4]|uniref:DUF485 domain-containing protein n=1 Tax=Raineyella sp. W15-4 TaxID=3081651 RepID=UPI0029533DA7|nr:DUF485 domain-containing protein [Raineyella sp. W15-4]WOQ17967.1 DUF485 domain-containing protein [Raineyella sp. W15-4]